MVYLAETGIGEKFILDTACQEMLRWISKLFKITKIKWIIFVSNLSHATQRVNECINEVNDVKNQYKICQLKLEVARTKVEKLQRQFKGAIKISRFLKSLNLLLVFYNFVSRVFCFVLFLFYLKFVLTWNMY